MNKERLHVFNTGEIIGRLTVIREIDPILDNYGKKCRIIECKCKCGNIIYVRAGNLVERSYKNRTESCGCLLSERNIRVLTIHGLYYHPLHKVWASMKARTRDNPNHKAYHRYYGVGVRLCPEWEDFITFYNWAIDKWKQGLELDKDILYYEKFGTSPGLLYSPEFCCFITARRNNQNKKTSLRYDYKGQKLTLGEIATLNNMAWHTIYSRVKRRKMTIEEAIEKRDYRVQRRTI